MQSANVVFPDPFPPTIAKKSPFKTSRLTLFNAKVPSGYLNSRSLMEIATSLGFSIF